MEWIIGLVIIGLFLLAIGLFFLFVRFTIVGEGTAKTVMSFGSFSEILFQWKDHWMDENWNILRKDEKGGQKKETGLQICGGLYLYGIWPIHKIHKYKHRWTDLHLREEGKMELELHEEKLFNHVLLKPAVYAIKLFAIETVPPERIPVDVIVLLTLRITNPYLFLFVAPPTPLEDVFARTSALMREIITTRTVDELLTLKGEQLWFEEQEEREKEPLLKGAKLIEDTLVKWGMKLADRGIEIKDIDLPPEYQKAAAAQKKMEFEAIARSVETAGTVIEIMARARGKEAKDIQEEIDAQPELKREFLDLAKDLVVRKLGIEGRSYLDIRVQGAEGIERTILNALATWKGMPTGGSSSEQKPEPESGSESESEQKPELATADTASSKNLKEVWHQVFEGKEQKAKEKK